MIGMLTVRRIDHTFGSNTDVTTEMRKLLIKLQKAIESYRAFDKDHTIYVLGQYQTSRNNPCYELEICRFESNDQELEVNPDMFYCSCLNELNLLTECRIAENIKVPGKTYDYPDFIYVLPSDNDPERSPALYRNTFDECYDTMDCEVFSNYTQKFKSLSNSQKRDQAGITLDDVIKVIDGKNVKLSRVRQHTKFKEYLRSIDERIYEAYNDVVRYQISKCRNKAYQDLLLTPSCVDDKLISIVNVGMLTGLTRTSIYTWLRRTEIKSINFWNNSILRNDIEVTVGMMEPHIVEIQRRVSVLTK